MKCGRMSLMINDVEYLLIRNHLAMQDGFFLRGWLHPRGFQNDWSCWCLHALDWFPEGDTPVGKWGKSKWSTDQNLGI